ncbi:MAG: hypothetical protein ABSE21_00880 [Bryobacteraceae bacterium]|jgi:hypothetical protein
MKTMKCLPIILMIATFTSVLPQTTHKQNAAIAKPQTGTVSGRVFGITGDGDLKPARFTKVYLLYEYGVLTLNKDVSSSVTLKWFDEKLQASKAVTQEVEQNQIDSESIICRKQLATYDIAMLATLKWAEEQKRGTEIVYGEADEEGRFTLAARPGLYYLVARGRAGFSNAAWVLDDVDVKAGQETTVKVVKVDQSCLVTE